MMIDSESTSIMDMRYACMACQNGCSADSYFTTYQPLLVLPIRASDSKAGMGWPAEGGPACAAAADERWNRR